MSAAESNKQALEEGSAFQPVFNCDGLITTIASDAGSGDILMVAWMNAEALALSLDTGVAHFWSRSRKKLWRKGEKSGNMLKLHEILTDCDQDTLWLKVSVQGDGVACHTGRRSCFYRRLIPSTAAGTGRIVLQNVEGEGAGRQTTSC